MIPRGIGVDLVPVSRIAALLDRQDGFLATIYTARELAYCRRLRRRSAERFAGRFAAKEAVLKALGTGIDRGIEMCDVEVVADPFGRPDVRLHGAARSAAARAGVGRLLVSISHCDAYAIAYAVACPADGAPAHAAPQWPLPDRRGLSPS